MNFRYTISLRIWQDIYTRQELSLRLGMEHEAGPGPERPLENGMAYWRRRLVEGETGDKQFATALEEVVLALERQSVLMFSLGHGNGSVELLIGLFISRNAVHCLDPKTMMRLGQLGVRLCFDIGVE